MSCVDTIILPDDKTIEEDFWQTKKDVQTAVNGAYSGLANKDLQTRFIVWTMRSDELNVNTSLNNSGLNQIYSATMQTTNGYCNWNNLYSIINNCNLVISKSESVMAIDPNYLQGDNNSNLGQMHALRALAYFYLVRVFRDVPLVTIPYKESSQEMNIPQSAPSVVIEQIIEDLEYAKDNVLITQSESGWKRTGYITRDAVYAMLADVYLWKASVLGDEESYDKCIECCNVVRYNRSKETAGFHFGPNTERLDDDGFNLNSYRNYYNVFAGQGNDPESIFEIQFNPTNEGLCNAYYKTKDASNAQPTFYTNEVYAKLNADENHVFNRSGSSQDVRGFESVFQFNGSAEDGVQIRKFVSMNGNNGALTAQSTSTREYKSYDQNWILYRATDVMLMKAEAMVQKALCIAKRNASLAESLQSATSDDQRKQIAAQVYDVLKEITANNVTAVRQVQIVNTRAHADGIADIDSTAYSLKLASPEETTETMETYASQIVSAFNSISTTARDLEILVMDERARELCYEGKRWFDMMRFNYRHVVGVQYDVILGNQTNFVKNYPDMLKLIARKYTSGGGPAVTAKMTTEPYLYMPISKGETEVNPSLVQNPVYTDGGTTEKNY